MSGEFDVFDEWGSYVGKFTPAGGGWDGCLFAIAMLFLWTVGFLVYLLVKLVVQGFRAAGRKEWDKAVAYWAIPGLIVGVFFLNLASSAATQAAQERERLLMEDLVRQEVSRAASNPEQTLTFERLPGDGKTDLTGYSRRVVGMYRVTNNTELRLLLRSEECSLYESPISPNETVSVECVEQMARGSVYWETLDPCITVLSYSIRDFPTADICATPPSEWGGRPSPSSMVNLEIFVGPPRTDEDGAGNCIGTDVIYARVSAREGLDRKISLRAFLEWEVEPPSWRATNFGVEGVLRPYSEVLLHYCGTPPDIARVCVDLSAPNTPEARVCAGYPR